jgi:hypothetical protein
MEILYFIGAFILLTAVTYGSLSYRYRDYQDKFRRKTADQIVRDRYDHNQARLGGAARRRAELVPLEILNVALVLFRRCARFEGAEIAALAGLWVDLAGVEPVLA